MANKTYENWLEIDLQAIENNLTPQWEMTEEQMNLLDTLT